MTEMVYKFVRVDEHGLLRSPFATGRWKLLYELDHCTIPRCAVSQLFAFRSRENALESWYGDPVEQRVRLYEAVTSVCQNLPALMPLVADEKNWQEYWLWFQQGMPPGLRNPSWKLYQPCESLVLCKDITLIRCVW